MNQLFPIRCGRIGQKIFGLYPIKNQNVNSVIARLKCLEAIQLLLRNFAALMTLSTSYGIQ